MDLYINILEIIGTVAFALSGAIEGIRHKLDAFGVIICGIVTATGGGIIRDLVIGQIPPKALLEPKYILIATATSLLVFLVAWRYKARILEFLAKNRIVNFADNIGLATFTIIAIERCLPQFAGNNSVLLFVGVITGVGGGVLRDIFTDTIPTIFRKRVYAVASLVGAILFIHSYMLIGLELSSIISMVLIVTIRTCASKFSWDIPKISLEEE